MFMNEEYYYVAALKFLSYFYGILATPAEVIGHYYCFLVDNLDNSVICQIMLELKLLSEKDLIHCAKMYSDHQQNMYLLDRLLVTSTASINDFCRKLQNTNNQEVGCMLVTGKN